MDAPPPRELAEAAAPAGKALPAVWRLATLVHVRGLSYGV